MTYAKRSILSSDSSPYQCQHDWGDVFCQCGDRGMVFPKGTIQKVFNNPELCADVIAETLPHKTVAFFEAFPEQPVSTFIRGEGETVEEAENKAWAEWQRISSCQNHEFDRRKYRNGAGLCIHCGLFKSNAFEPLEKCCICGVATYYATDTQGAFYCKEHEKAIPDNLVPETHRVVEAMKSLMKKDACQD